MLQCTLKNYKLQKKNSKCMNFGTKLTHFEKNKKISKCVDIVDVNAPWKKIAQGLVEIIDTWYFNIYNK